VTDTPGPFSVPARGPIGLLVVAVLVGAAFLFAATSWLSHLCAEEAAALGSADSITLWHMQTVLAGGGSAALLLLSLFLFRRQRSSLRRLEYSEARHRTLFTRAKVAMLLIDPADGTIADANDAACRFYGYPIERLKGMRIGEINTLEPAEVVAEMARAEREEREHLYFRHRLANGQEREVEVHSGPLVLDGRRLLFSVIHDITARRRAEAALDESERRFRSLVEGSADWIWETDAEHRFTWVSPSFETVTGRSVASLIGKRRWDLISDRAENDSEAWRRHREDVAAGRPFRDFRYWLAGADGEPRWMSVSGSPRVDCDGHVIGYRGIGTDFTAQAAATQRLRMLSKVVEQSPVSVLIAGLDYRIQYVNPSVLASCGYTRDELVGQDVAVLTAPGTEAVIAEIRATVEGGHTWLGELQTRRKDGGVFWESVVIFPVTDDVGTASHYVAIREDITFRKEAEARIAEANQRTAEQKRQLEQSNAELEQFAYVASHDLRQPLRMVSSYLSLIERRLDSVIDGELREFFNYATGGARRMDALIRDLLEYSRIGRRERPFAQVPLAQAVADSLVNLQVAVNESGTEVVVADGLPVISGDPGELARLFQNLIGNAIQYRDPARPARVEVGWRDDGAEWEIWVKDNGIGIRPEDFERAFGIFQRLTPDGGDGTGIGLAVCRKVVEHHRGRIWIESAPGEGSTFRVALPKA